MKSSNSVNQNQHCISQTRQHEQKSLLERWVSGTLRLMSLLSGESKPLHTENVQL